MSKINCKVSVTSTSRHLHQLYTGLILLDRAGVIDLDVGFPEESAPGSSCHVTLNGASLVFDVHDAGGFYQESLADCDFYFKRSYCQAAVDDSGFSGRIFRYGLNYHVVPDVFSPLFLKVYRKSGGLQAAFRYLVKQLDRHSWAHFDPTLRNMQSPPEFPRQFGLLFLARAWDHTYDEDFAMTEAISEDRLRLNQVRADCIRSLRDEFGAAFTGGLAHTEYASKHFADCLAPSAGMTSKRSYLEQVRQHPVCVATTGLEQSVGWKFGEYVAFSRAILSEKLAYEVPGDLSANRHYLQFETVDECLEQACALANDNDRLYGMMHCNHEYYEEWLRPDALVWNCLSQAL